MFECSPVQAGKNGLSKVTLQSSDGTCSCEVYLFGATVTSWKVNSEEKLYVSPITPFDGKKAIRGGIPIVFPQFGRPCSDLPQHGFARTSVWTIAESQASETSCEIVLALNSAGESSNVWPYKFSLKLRVVLAADSLTTKLDISNEGDTSFECQALLHSYLSVPNINSVQVAGFESSSYIDQLVNGSGLENLSVDSRPSANIDREVDRIYLPKSTECEQVVVRASTVASTEETAEGDSERVIARIARSAHKMRQGSDSQELRPVGADCVLWNAWIEKAKAMADLPDLDYHAYVCVEPGLVAHAHVVEPHEILTLSQTLSP